MAAFLANMLSDRGTISLTMSAVAGVQPTHSTPTKFGFDEIYLINLRRRPERLRKMNEVFKLLGIAYRRFEAVDGQSDADLAKFDGMRFLPGYTDPFHKRPMKK